jgi:outer membrane protein TolC
VKQHELIAKSGEYSVENISKGYYPQVNLMGQATYQSDVTNIPIKIPNVNIPELSKDQYRLYVEINQPLYEGGVVKQQKKIQEANSQVEEQKLEVELYKLKDRVNQLFFGILLIDEQIKQTTLLKKDIQSGLDKTQAYVDNGAAFKSSINILKAELLKVDQKTIELKSARRAYCDMLGLMINITIDEKTILVRPSALSSSTEIKRPELQMFSYQTNILEEQSKLIAARNRPKLNFFVQGGFGRPAFNMFSNSFDPYYIGGLRLNFPLSGFYTIKNDKALLAIGKQNIDIQKETFLFNTGFTLKQQNAEITKLQELVKSDDEIVALRASVKTTAFTQMENGVITANDYLREVNAEDAAKQSKIQHELQLLMAEYNLQFTNNN